MKIKTLVVGTVLFLFTCIMSPVGASANDIAIVNETPEMTAQRLQSRLDEIKTIDKTTLSHSEKKALRREVRAIKKELAAVSGGVYLSVGAILLIALLLILLL